MDSKQQSTTIFHSFLRKQDAAQRLPRPAVVKGNNSYYPTYAYVDTKNFLDIILLIVIRYIFKTATLYCNYFTIVIKCAPFFKL